MWGSAMRSSVWPLMILLLASAGMVGCARTVLESSAVDDWPGNEAELEYLEALETQRVVTNHDALHGLLLLADGADPHETYEQRLADARQRGWLARDAAPEANESAAIGMMAVAACDILAIKGGLTMRLLGPSPRYCTRELIFLDILPPRTEHQSLSGLEFIDLLGRIEDRLGEESRGREGAIDGSEDRSPSWAAPGHELGGSGHVRGGERPGRHVYPAR